ncbi:MAG: BMP family protein [Actinomycetota bacterium]|nr:BMP family protein [Actinomycetota bacterium]
MTVRSLAQYHQFPYNNNKNKGSIMKATSTRVIASAVAALALVAASCGGSDDTADAPATDAPAATIAAADEPAAEPAAEPAEPMRIGLVAPSAVNDVAWTQAMFDSLNRVGQGRDIEIAVTDGTFVVEDAAAAIRGYAEDGFDLVIAHGTQYGGPLQEIATDFPDVSFMIGTSSDFFGIDNIFAYSVEAGEAGYVNGVVAAQLTESNNIGVVGPVPAGDAKLYIDGFVAGVAAQNPDVKVNVNYIDSFSDVLLASEAAKALVGAGADVLTGSAQMVVGAIGVAVEEGVPWLGSQSNQTGLGEEVVVGSFVYHWEQLLNDVLDKIQAGTLGGEALSISVADGGLELEFNGAFPLDAAIKASTEATVAGIGDGTIEVPASE